jgi:hypothetical protein
MNSARAADTWKTRRPPGAVVSSASWSDWKPMPPLAQAGDDGDQVLDRAAQPAEGGHHQGVAGPEVVEALPQFLALRVLARLLVGEDACAASRVQGRDLPIDGDFVYVVYRNGKPKTDAYGRPMGETGQGEHSQAQHDADRMYFPWPTTSARTPKPWSTSSTAQ